MKQFSELLSTRLLINYGLLLALGLPGFALLFCANNRAVTLLLPLATILATCLIFYTVSRLRFPLTPFLAIGAGCFIESIIYLFKARSWTSLAICTVAFLVILGSSLFVKISKPHPAALQYQLAKAYYQNGRLIEAQASLTGAAADFEPQRSQLLLANIALQSGDFPNAINLYQQLLQQEPLSYEANSNKTLKQKLLSLQKDSPALAFCIINDILNSKFATRARDLEHLHQAFQRTYDCTDIR